MPRSGRRAKLSKALLCRVSGGALASVASLLLAAGLAGCGGASATPSDSSSREVVARVGAVAIDRRAVEHWARAIALGSTVAGSLGQSTPTPRQKALEFLISANWAIGAAAQRGLAVSEEAVRRGLNERIEAAAGRRSEFQEEIASTGQTLADVKLEVKAALASRRLRESLSRSVPRVTQAQIADYYKRHLQSFRVPERRWVDLIEEIHGYAHAVALGKRLGAGKLFARRAMRDLVARETPYEDAHHDWKAAMLHAIFATPPGRVGGPVSFHNRWVLLVVRRLVPPSIKPLKEVNAAISQHLFEERHALALASFLRAYRRGWGAKTRCVTGFVVQKCSEYRGRLVPEGNLLASSD
jgi:hypothetical protein